MRLALRRVVPQYLTIEDAQRVARRGAVAHDLGERPLQERKQRVPAGRLQPASRTSGQVLALLDDVPRVAELLGHPPVLALGLVNDERALVRAEERRGRDRAARRRGEELGHVGAVGRVRVGLYVDWHVDGGRRGTIRGPGLERLARARRRGVMFNHHEVYGLF